MVMVVLAAYRPAYSSSVSLVQRSAATWVLFYIHRVNRVNSRND